MPDADACTRCGYAVPLDRDRCLSCGRRIRHRSANQTVVSGPARTGEAAADAWAAWSAAIPEHSPAPELGNLDGYADVTPLAVGLVESLRLARIAFAVLATVSAVRLGVALAADDAAELLALGWWDTLDRILAATALITGGILLVVALFGLRWAQAAFANLRVLALRLHTPPARRVRAVTVAAAAAVAAGSWAWSDHPLATERTTALVTLAVAVVGFTLASALRPGIAALSLVERERADLIARIDAAADRASRHGRAKQSAA